MGGGGRRWWRLRSPAHTAAVVIRIDGLGSLRNRDGAAAALGAVVGMARCLTGILRLCSGVAVDWQSEVTALVPPRRAARLLRDLVRLRGAVGAACPPGITARVVVAIGTAGDSGDLLLARARSACSDTASWTVIDVQGTTTPGRAERGLAGTLARRMAGPVTQLPDPQIGAPQLQRPRAALHPAVEAHFQPQLCCHTGETTGFEALARLRDPVRGLLMPGQFLPMMDGAALRALSRAMLEHSLHALRHWDAAGHDVATVSLNLGGVDLSDPWLAEDVLWAIDRAELCPARLVVELLESLPPDLAPQTVARNLARLASAGCRIDLDDFGTGHSGFEAVHRSGAGRIKIDRSLIARCDRDAARQGVIADVISTADRLGVKVLAEGVETPGEHGLVAQLGCSHVQGFAVARPMPLRDTDAFLLRCAERARALPQLRRA